MTNYGYIKVGLATPQVVVGSPQQNALEIIELLNKSKASLMLFPELVLTGYTSGDLFFQKSYLDETRQALKKIMRETTYEGVYVVGLPLKLQDVLYNTAVVVQKEKVLGIVPKYFLPNSKEFYEKRWFQSGFRADFNEVDFLGQKVPFGKILFKDEVEDISFGIEVCQDMWAISTPGDELALLGAHMILNLSASTEHLSKPEQRKYTVLNASRKQQGAYLYTSAGPSESTLDLVFSPHKIAASLGEMIREEDFLNASKLLYVDVDIEQIRYQRRMDNTFRDEQNRKKHDVLNVKVNFLQSDSYAFEQRLEKRPFVPQDEQALKLAFELQIRGLLGKLESLKGIKIVLGVSGGLDSTLALLVAHQAMKRLNRDTQDIIAVTMPSALTSSKSKLIALDLMEKLGVTAREVPISKDVEVHLEGLGHESESDVTFENVQARIRTLYLMNIANKEKGFVLGTGDMSEIALGWMTFNGDHMSMYNVNAGVPKTLVQALIRHHSEHQYAHIKDLLQAILNQPISPELKKDQNTEDEIGSYEINDFILYHFLVAGKNENECAFLVEKTFDLSQKEATMYAKRFFKRFYSQQFKRQVMPEGPKVHKVSLSPRGELRLPSEIKK